MTSLPSRVSVPHVTRQTVALAASVLVFASPQISRTLDGPAVSYPLLSIVFAVLLVTIVVTWPDGVAQRSRERHRIRSGWLSGAAVAAVAVTLIAMAMHRWMRTVVWEPPRADMLIVIREATRRFLRGGNPYTTYRTFDAPWNMVLPYGPALWGPFLLPQLLQIDFRIVTIVGQLFVPVWCGIAAAFEAAQNIGSSFPRSASKSAIGRLVPITSSP